MKTGKVATFNNLSLFKTCVAKTAKFANAHREFLSVMAIVKRSRLCSFASADGDIVQKKNKKKKQVIWSIYSNKTYRQKYGFSL